MYIFTDHKKMCYGLITLKPDDLQCPDSPLRRKSEPISIVNAAIRSLVAYLMEHCRQIPYATGLAAIQVGVPLRVFVITLNRPLGKELVMINPIVLSASGRPTTRTEGCISLPHFKGPVTRRNRVIIQAATLEGDIIVHDARGYEAAVIQHELDHLSGLLYWDRMTSGLKPEPIP